MRDYQEVESVACLHQVLDYLDDENKEDEICRTCNTCEKYEKSAQRFGHEIRMEGVASKVLFVDKRVIF